MKKFSSYIIFLTLLTLPFTGVGQDRTLPEYLKAEYLWPTDASRYLSSTFGETRSRHFHSALDIKTWGRKGYRVMATRDGVVYRLAVGPKGYGKVVYLKHDDGSFSVYAHLLAFNDRLQQLVDSIRFRDYSFELDQVVESKNLQVQKGQTIGLSGASGVGPPHLHFELRTPTGSPFNPLLTNLSVSDHIAPQFSGIAVEPLGPETVIEGKNRIYEQHAVRRDGSFDFGTINVKGPVGLSVDVFDQADRVSNAYAVYELKLLQGDQLLFHAKADSFSYSETDQMFLDRVYPLLRKNGDGYQRLYLADGNTLPFYAHNPGGGRLNLPPGSHTLSIIATDFYGNSSRATLTIAVPETESETITSSNGSNDRFSTMEEWDWHPDWINFNSGASHQFVFYPLENGLYPPGPIRISGRSYLPLKEHSLSLLLDPSGTGHRLYRIYPSDERKIISTDGRAYAHFERGTVYDTLSLAISRRVAKPDSVIVEIRPQNQPLRKSFELTCHLEGETADIRKMGFYLYNKKRDSFDYLETRHGGNVLKSDPESLGTYVVMSDTTAPELYRPRLQQREDGHWIVTVPAYDDRSGIDYTSAVLSVDGVRGIAEFEPENNQLIYYHPQFKPKDSMRVAVSVADRTGNRTEKSYLLN
ncbi:MAG: M23 family metallopeptidase [Balneolaceae bacterium]|nr:M23 family metallopeptidase [Balneolaceae bacterium]